MEAKTRRLVITVEVLALTVSALLILIDYKLKKDLLILIRRIEEALIEATHAMEPSRDLDPDSLRVGDLASHDARVEEEATPNGSAQRARARGTRRGPVVDRGRGVGDQAVSHDGEPLGT